MLERTASSLELCAVHRNLYRPARHARLCRRLPPSFWQHGTAALELSAAWVALQRARARTARDCNSRSTPLSTRYDALESLCLPAANLLSSTRRQPFLPDSHDRLFSTPSLLHARPIATSAPRHMLALPHESLASIPYKSNSSAVGRFDVFSGRRHLSSGSPRHYIEAGVARHPSKDGELGQDQNHKRDYDREQVHGREAWDNTRLGRDGERGLGNNTRDNEPRKIHAGHHDTLNEETISYANRQQSVEELNEQREAGASKHVEELPEVRGNRPTSRQDHSGKARKTISQMIDSQPKSQDGSSLGDRVWELIEALPPPERRPIWRTAFNYYLQISDTKANFLRCLSIVSGYENRIHGESLKAVVHHALQHGEHGHALTYLELSLRRERHPHTQGGEKHLMAGAGKEKHAKGRRKPPRRISPDCPDSEFIFRMILRSCFTTASWSQLRTLYHCWLTRAPSGTEIPTSKRLDEIPELANTVLQFQQYLQGRLSHDGDTIKLEDSQDGNTSKAPNASSSDSPARGSKVDIAVSRALDELFVEASRSVLVGLYEPSDVVNWLKTTGHPELYIDYVRAMTKNLTTGRLSTVFRQYKKLVGPALDLHSLQVTFDAFYPYDPEGLLEVHEDFCNLYYGGDETAPRDQTMLHTWWTNYAVRAVLSRCAQDPLAFLPYIEPFRRRDDSEAVRFAMKRLTGSSRHVSANDVSWYGELKAYAGKLDYEGAMRVWRPRFDSDNPDIITLITLLRLAGERGDVAFTAGLFDKAKEWGFDLEPQVLIPVVRAFGLQRSPKEAGKVAFWAFGNGVRDTLVFNALLEAYSSANLLHELRSVMAFMTENHIAWDEQTYLHLIKAMGRTKRGYDAHCVLGGAPAAVFGRFSLDQMESSMAAAVKADDYSLVYLLARRMKASGFSMTLGTMSLLAKAAYRWKQRAGEKGIPPHVEGELVTGKDLVDFYRKTIRSDVDTGSSDGTPGASHKKDGGTVHDAGRRDESPSDLDKEEQALVAEVVASRSTSSRSPSAPSQATQPPVASVESPAGDVLTVKRIAFTLAEMNDIESLHEFATLYLDTMKRPHSDRHLPDGILSAFMIAEFARGDYKRVKHLWRMLWDRHLYRAKQFSATKLSYKTSTKVPPNMQYGLDEPFRIMEQVLTLERDAQGLLTLVFNLKSEGFMLGQRSWNHAIQSLATMGKWKEAFRFNEQLLMPNWTGWKHYRRFKNLRRRRQAWEQHENTEPGVHPKHFLRKPGPPPEEYESLPPKEREYWEKERQFWLDNFVSEQFFRSMYNLRKMRRMQEARKAAGTSINLPPHLKDAGHNQRHLRPNSLTLHTLARVYLDMEESNKWIGNSQQWLDMFCPISVLAIKTLKEADEVEGTWGDRLHGPADEYEDAEEYGGGAEKVLEAENVPASQNESATPAGNKAPKKWKEQGIPVDLRNSIQNVLTSGPKRRAARLRATAKETARRRRAEEQAEEQEAELRRQEEIELEERARQRDVWLRQAGVVDVSDELEEEQVEAKDEEEDELKRLRQRFDPRLEKHKARRGVKQRARPGSKKA